MPILTKLGVISDARPHLPKRARLPTPVFGTGTPGSGLTALAEALSMIGYRCCSDWSDLLAPERAALDRGSRRLRFSAYVNIAAFKLDELCEYGSKYPQARFIVCTPQEEDLVVQRADDVARLSGHLGSERVLHLPLNRADKWKDLCSFLDVPYPNSRYPRSARSRTAVDRRANGYRANDVVPTFEPTADRCHPVDRT